MNKLCVKTTVLLTLAFTSSTLFAADYSLTVKKEKLEVADTLKFDLGRIDVEHDQKTMCLTMTVKSLTTRDDGELKLEWLAIKQSVRSASEVVTKGNTLVSLIFNKAAVIRSDGFELRSKEVDFQRRSDINIEEEISGYAARLTNAEGEVLAYTYHPAKSKDSLKKLLDEVAKAEAEGKGELKQKDPKRRIGPGPKRGLKPRRN